jgi:hypothetical protein
MLKGAVMEIHVKFVVEPSDTTKQITSYAVGFSHERTPITKDDQKGGEFPGTFLPGGTEIDIPTTGSVTLYSPGTNWEHVCGGGRIHSIPYDPHPDSPGNPSQPAGGTGTPLPPPPPKIPSRPRPWSHEVPSEAERFTSVLDSLSQFLEQQQLPSEMIESLQAQFIDPLISTVDTFSPEERQILLDRLTAPDGLLTRFGSPQQQHRVQGLNDDA